MSSRPATLVRFITPLLGIAMAAAAAGFPPPAWAEPVRTVLTAESGDGALEFCTDLARLWRNRYEPTPEHLVVRTLDAPDARLRAVSRGRADFAVVDAQVAADRLSTYPRLAAVAVLWPTVLHVVTRNPRPRELGLPVTTETWFFKGTGFAARVLADATRKAPDQRARLHRMNEDLLMDALDYAREPVVLFGGPVPTAELDQAMSRDSSLHLLPVSGKLLEELRLAYPWLATEKVERGAYRGLDRTMELPAVYQILVGRRDLPSDTVRKVLNTVYGRGNALARFDPLFAQPDSRLNAVFGKLMAFHPATAQRYNFTSALP